jgi:hypothetical protein
MPGLRMLPEGIDSIQEMKVFLKDARKIYGYQTSTYIDRWWEKPDGTIWIVHESKLESPEDDYVVSKYTK